MTASTYRAAVALGRRHAAAAAAAALMLSGFALTGCSIVRAVKNVSHAVEHNRGIIDTFTSTLKANEGTTFAATYVTTGSSPATVVYAVKPPNGLAFQSFPSGPASGGDLEVIVNSSGEYSCSRPSSAAPWTCEKLTAATAAVKKAIFGLYTPSHWVAFLKGFALAAGFAGDKVTTSSMTVNGFSMKCVDFVAPGVAGTSTICTTAQGILGYVKVASTNASFQIKSYTASPSAALFALPPGAKVTNLRNGG